MKPVLVDEVWKKDFEQAESKREAENARGGSGTGGGGPTDGEMEHRVAFLEKSFEKIDGKLDKMLDRSAAADARLASIDAKLDAKASSSEVAKIDPVVKGIGDVVIDIRTLRDNARTDYRVLFGAIIVTALGLAGLIAKVAKWY